MDTPQVLKRRVVKDFYPLALLALLLFVPLFVLRQLFFLDFWWWMSLNLVVLCTLALARDGGLLRELVADLKSHRGRKILMGFVFAGILYLVFWAGNHLVRGWFDFAGGDISRVYGFKGEAGGWRIALLMLFVIGPGEELFWRGFVQGNLTSLFGRYSGFWSAVFFYTLIHVATGNLVLLLAALTGGIFWGWMYIRYRSLLMNMISHIVWDIGVFLILPFGS